jgi:hypothetical protein
MLMSDDRIDQAASVVNSVMHQGDGGRQARELLAFDANTMGRADYNAVIQQVSTTEALQINELMRQGNHDAALNMLREDANIFLNHDQFMGLAGEVRAMNKATQTPTHLEFNPIYQNGDQPGRPTAVEVDLATRYRNPQTGQEWEKRDPVARVDNHIGPEVQPIAPPQVVVVEPPPQVIIEERNRPGFTFNLEIEIGRERVRRHDPRWCPDNNWRPHNAPPGFNLEIEINRTRDDYRRRGDNDWSPRRPTSQTIINQVNNTTIINNNTTIRNDSHDKNINVDKSRTRVINEAPAQQQQQRREVPQRGEPTQQRREAPQRGDNAQQRPETPRPQPRSDAQPQQPRGEAPQQRRENPNADQRRDELQQRRDAAQQRREDARAGREQPHQRRDDDDDKRKERKKN